MSQRKILGLIPARGNSKGIPRKNLTIFDNKPLLQWTIEAAIKSKSLDRIIVSTDDYEIAEFAKKLGAEVPFLRSKDLARDDSLIFDTVAEIINKFDKFDDLILLQPTSPLRTKDDIRKAIKIKEELKTSSVVSVSEANENPTIFYNINEKNYLAKSFKNLKLNNRQSFKKYYVINGAIYLASYHQLRKYRNFITSQTTPYIMPKERSLDIDTQLDLQWGEFLINNSTKL